MVAAAAGTAALLSCVVVTTPRLPEKPERSAHQRGSWLRAARASVWNRYSFCQLRLWARVTPLLQRGLGAGWEKRQMDNAHSSGFSV